MTLLWTHFPEIGLKSPEIQPKQAETGGNRFEGKMTKKGAKMRVWNIKDKFGQPSQVRLTDEGKLEIRGCGQRIWRLLGIVDISVWTHRDIQNYLRENGGIRKITRAAS